VTSVDVTLLTQTDCAFCEDAKLVLARVARDHELRVRVVDLATDAGQELAARAGVLFAPGVLLDGASFSYGRLSERRLRKELQRRGGSTRAGASNPA
jgi:glutaredoxin